MNGYITERFYEAHKGWIMIDNLIFGHFRSIGGLPLGKVPHVSEWIHKIIVYCNIILSWKLRIFHFPKGEKYFSGWSSVDLTWNEYIFVNDRINVMCQTECWFDCVKNLEKLKAFGRRKHSRGFGQGGHGPPSGFCKNISWSRKKMVTKRSRTNWCQVFWSANEA